MSESDKFPNPSTFQSQPEAVLKPDGRFMLNGEPYFELPAGSHRPEQMVIAELLKNLIPIAPITARTVEGEPGNTRYFSRFVDVTEPTAPTRPLVDVQAEFIALREIFLCRDRSFYEKDGYNYPARKVGVHGHNMDWIDKDPENKLVSAIHYDFEDFYKYLKWMKELWIDQQDPEIQKQRLQLMSQNLQQYVNQFGSEVLPVLKALLIMMKNTFSYEYVQASIDNAIAQQVLPETDIVHRSLQSKISTYIQLVDTAISANTTSSV